MEFVAIAQINKEGAKKVADLTDRPNITGGYGKPKLTPQDLKQWFDKFPDLICEKVNQILEAFKTTSTTEGEGDNQQTIAGNGNYIALNLGDNKSDNEQVKLGNSLAGLVNSLFNGAFAARLLVDLGESGKSDNLQSLLSILNNLTTNISTNAENISNLEEGKFAKYQNPDTGEYEDKIVTNQIAAGAVTSEKIDSELLKNMVFEDELEGFIDGIDYNEKEYKLTFTRKGVENPIVVDLPVETLVLSVEYVSSSKSLRIKLTNGNVIDVSLNDIITGLVNSSDILHTTGTSDNKVMSQKAVTDALKNVDGKHINLVQVEKVIDYNTGTIIPTLKLERENGGYVGIALDDLIPSKIKKSFSDVAYDATTGVLTFTSNDGKTSKTVNLPLELFVSSGVYNSDSEQIELTLANGDVIPIDLKDLADKIDVQIKDRSITTDKIADGAVTSKKIEDGAVELDKLSSDVKNEIDRKVDKSSLVTTPKEGAVPKYNTYGILQGYTAKNDDDLVNLRLLNTKMGEVKAETAELEKRVETLEGLTLAKIIDDTVAYEKVVPANVGSRAAINKVGGISYKSRNICVADRRVDLTGENYYRLSLGTYEAGEYYLSLISNVSGAYEYTLSSNHFGYSFFENTTFELPSESEVWLEIPSEHFVDNKGVYLSGEIEGIMICPADEEDKSYEPYFEGYVKPTSIESWSRRSNNLCVNDGPETLVNVFHYKRKLATLGPGRYYVRVNTSELHNHYEALITSDSNEVNNSFDYYWGFEFELSGETTVYLELPSSEEAEGMPDGCINGEIISIMLCNASDEDKTYKPYAPVKLISTFEIPEAIRNLPDYGTDGSYIDFDRKVWVGAGGAETDMSAYLSSYKKYFYMDVQPGGTLKFINDGSNDVPSTVTYVKKL